MEYLNLYDKTGNLINKKGIRGQVTDYLVGIAIVFIENSKGEFLIQKTCLSKGNIFATTGGHVTYGTTFLETIKNEIKEELGIEVNKDKIIEVKTYIKDEYVQKVYYLKEDINLKDIVCDKNEVEYVEWINKDKINELIKNNMFRQSNIEAYKYIIDNIN